MATCLLATIPGWHVEMDARGSLRDVKPFPSRPLIGTILAIEFVACCLMIAAALWQHVAAVAFSTATSFLSAQSVSTEIGAVGIALAWVESILLMASWVGVDVMMSRIDMLDQLTDEGAGGRVVREPSVSVDDGDE